MEVWDTYGLNHPYLVRGEQECTVMFGTFAIMSSPRFALIYDECAGQASLSTLN